MGLRFRKSVGLTKGVKLNFGKKSVGVSVGNRYSGMSFNSKTGARARVSAPGTGVSYSTKVGGGRRTRSSEKKPLLKRWWVWLIIILVIAFLAIPTDSTDDNEDPNPSTSQNQEANLEPIG